jgi:hypothetical protein
MRDSRYKYAHTIWEAGQFPNFQEIFKIIPISIVAVDIGINFQRFKKRVENPELFTIKELSKLSRLTGIEEKALVSLAIDYKNVKKTSIAKLEKPIAY